MVCESICVGRTCWSRGLDDIGQEIWREAATMLGIWSAANVIYMEDLVCDVSGRDTPNGM